MNRIYRLVWNSEVGNMVAVAENARGRCKSGTGQSVVAGAVALTGCLLLTSVAHAGPDGFQVTAGTGSVAHTGNTTTITQGSQNLSLGWSTFNVGAQETVHFVQPSASAIAVNRIHDTHGSQILGQLNANGQVFLINPNGVLFGAGAQVNVGGLVASTLDLGDASLGSSTRSFSGTGSGSVVNQGRITAASGGYVALLGNTVRNAGQISAQRGTVALGAGSAATLTFAGNSLVALQIDQSTLHTLAENQQLIQADGGTVLMSAGAKDALLASVVNNTGIIEARTVDQHNGTIVLLGGMAAGTVQVGGTLDASAPHGGNGGFIETSAAHVKVANSAQITTAAPTGGNGTWLIDPVDFTVAASGGDITGAALGNLLDSNSVTVQTATGTPSPTALYGSSGTNGDIQVNDAVRWSSNTTLTLNAWRNININQSITATGSSGKLALQYGQGATNGVVGGTPATYTVNAPVNLQAGPNFSTQLGTAGALVDYTVLTSLGAEGSTTAADLQGVAGNLAGKYVLGAQIDATATSNWNSGAGFAPLGDASTRFTGIFDGLGHTITGLTVNRAGAAYGGLFGYTQSAAIRNVGLVGGSVRGSANVGGLVGYSSAGTIAHSYSTGSVSGTTRVGGLVGYSSSTTISNSYVTGSVIGSSGYVGGLVGYQVTGTVSSNYTTGSVSGSSIYVGGLVGYQIGGTASSNYTTGSVSGTSYVGGLLGYLSGGTVSNNYTTGTVSGSSIYVGGLIGYNVSGTVSNSYATGRVSGSGGAIGGLMGYNSSGSISNNYWDTFSTGKASAIGSGANIGAYAVTSDPTRSADANYAFKQSAYSRLNFASTWYMVDGATRPFLRVEYSPTITNAHQLQLMAMNLGASYTLALDINATETGTAISRSAGMWSSAGFAPVGNGSTAFSGSFDGLGHTVSGLKIDRPTTDMVGLFGKTLDSTIRNVGLVGGSVSGADGVGALVGYNQGAISNSYATGVVSGTGDYAGGLVGQNNGAISNSYATGNVSAPDFAGGLVGGNIGGTVANSYATGSVSGPNHVGGLVGATTSGLVTDSFWNTSTSGQTGSSGGTGLTTAQMMELSSFAHWSIANTGGSSAVWRIYEGHTAPLLRSFLTPLALGDTALAYNGTTQSGTATSTAGVLGMAASGRNAGTYTGYYSGQQGYDIVGGALTITPLALTVTGLVAASKVYDASTAATVSSAGAVYTGRLDGDDVLVSATGMFADKNVGNGKTVNLGSTYSGADAGNYAITDQASTSANITPATLTYTATPATRSTGQIPGGLGGTVTGMVGGETLASATTGTLDWSTPAVASSLPGLYAINGTGLGSTNYRLVQASSNATALALNAEVVAPPPPAPPVQPPPPVPTVSSTPPQPVLNAVAQLQSRTPPVAPESYRRTTVSTAMNFDGTGPSLNIVTSGIRLPAHLDADNE
ncbi:filamentous hemagglutinin N-terminal domain-containing protein [Rhodoferax sp. WC2427]|uniref:two-partner secretion domain-containing protein n=1 Tax=Rhodoferax sp. WC2427 TaxID=3234144 RepID=UPI0034664D3E